MPNAFVFVKKGNIMLAGIPLVLVGFLFSVLIVNVGRAYYLKNKAAQVADNVLLSSLRVGAQSREAWAAGWRAFENKFHSGDHKYAYTHSKNWIDMARASDEIHKRISGYKVRMTGVRTVVLNSHGLLKEVLVPYPKTQQWPIESRPLEVVNEKGAVQHLEHGWYARTWSPANRWSRIQPWPRLHVNLPLDLLGSSSKWILTAAAQGHVLWDVDINDQNIRENGHGGFPRIWTDVIKTGFVKAHPFPFFRGELAYE